MKDRWKNPIKGWDGIGKPSVTLLVFPKPDPMSAVKGMQERVNRP